MSKDKPTPGGRAKKNTAVSLVRSSAAEYLSFVAASGQGDIEAVYADENVWISQKMKGLFYGVETHTVTYYLKQIVADGELQADSVIRNFRITAADGKTYDTQHYNLAAITAVGYKVNSERAVRDAVDAGKVKLTSLFGHLSRHFVRISPRIMGTERRRAVAVDDSAGLQLADLVARPIGLSVLRPGQPSRAFDAVKPKLLVKNGRADEWGLKCYP